MNKEDPRAIRSKRMLKEAVIGLLVENPDISKLTVQNITKSAGLNRATFYLHFHDITDLLRQIVYDIFDDLLQKKFPILHIDDAGSKEKLIVFLDYFYHHRKILSVLFEGPGFKKQLQIILKDIVVTQNDDQDINQIKTNLSKDIISSSLLGIIMWWLKDGVDFSSEYIANQIIKLYQ